MARVDQYVKRMGHRDLELLRLAGEFRCITIPQIRRLCGKPNGKYLDVRTIYYMIEHWEKAGLAFRTYDFGKSKVRTSDTPMMIVPTQDGLDFAGLPYKADTYIKDPLHEIGVFNYYLYMREHIPQGYVFLDCETDRRLKHRSAISAREAKEKRVYRPDFTFKVQPIDREEPQVWSFNYERSHKDYSDYQHIIPFLAECYDLNFYTAPKDKPAWNTLVTAMRMYAGESRDKFFLKDYEKIKLWCENFEVPPNSS